MFCPKCGAVLEYRLDNYMQRDVFYCRPGDMWLSANLTDRLIERFGDQPPPRDWTPPPYVPWWQGGHGHCPGCGTPLNSQRECDQCGKSIRDLTFTLVELHPHRGEIPPPGWKRPAH